MTLSCVAAMGVDFAVGAGAGGGLGLDGQGETFWPEQSVEHSTHRRSDAITVKERTANGRSRDFIVGYLFRTWRLALAVTA
jgi:hypothetical protein